ncbi:hypothetical protein [Streptomyces sp. Isolate_45]|uniref:hypothetical protein n=1 Tax=Streptomyces sp. Isolate_45 TaxID=2950111 RepID=UPI002481DB47|nr:hypothetical protein [Streptomyces sp. Isolate_45]MDA5284296.1 hypothetical protein [Streptomyces sp. Isolate_45]
MLNPIDTDRVIRDGGAIGRFPDEIHPGVAWWMAACFVMTTRADRLAVAHDGKAATAEFFDRMCLGAINVQHYACLVLDRGVAGQGELLATMKELDRVPGMRVTSDQDIVTITLYDRDGNPLTEPTGLLVIRRMIAEDRVPIPVNAECKGRIQSYVEAAG